MGTGGAGGNAGGAAGALGTGGRTEVAEGGSGPLGGSSSGGKAGSGGGSSSGGVAGVGGESSSGGEAAGSGAQGGSGGTPPSDTFPGEPITTTSKLDLLLVIDNSIGMGIKQEIFREALEDTLRRLVNPPCVSASKSVSVGLGAACPQGTTRETAPVTDLHVGVISTSLGAHGGDTCVDAATDDHARLIPTLRGTGSYQGIGFTKWDAAGVGMPAGLADVDALVAEVDAAVTATGATGCGFEAQLESWYRFLIDPEPPLVVSRTSNNGVTHVEGIDGEVLAQRAAFLRPDSAVAIALLTDENDCSIIDHGQGWLVGLQTIGGAAFKFPRATSICETDPNDTCCRSCASVGEPAGCVAASEDPSCKLPGYTTSQDSLNLRCFDQQRRFGVNLLYPVERYINALTSPWVPRPAGGWARNPLFTEYEGKSRRPGLVSFAAIVGVPWQDIATPESLSGAGLEFLSASELARSGRWNVISKSPGGLAPSDPFMIESAEPRPTTAMNPITGDAIVSEESLDPTANAINGHEQLSEGYDLQKACIFELATPLENCVGGPCACTQANAHLNQAICQAPDGNTAANTQYYAPANPGLRELEVLRGIGSSAVVASACPKLTTADDPDRGYFPALRALRTRLSQVLK